MKKTANNNHKNKDKKSFKEKDPKEIKEPQKEENSNIKEPTSYAKGGTSPDPAVPPFLDEFQKPEEPHPNDDESLQDPSQHPPIVKERFDPNTFNNSGASRYYI